MVKLPSDFYLESLWHCGGYYQAIKDRSGRRLTPLVGYPGRYETNPGTQETKQYVGDTFANFAIIEQYPHVLDRFAKDLADKIKQSIGEVDYVVAAPLGGMALGKDLSRHLDCRYVFAEKKIIGLASGELLEQSELQLIRHEIDPGSRVILVEDACNNFSVTAELVSLVQRANAEVCGVSCALNRSRLTKVEIGGDTLPVIFLSQIVMAQYRQEDTEVNDDVMSGNVAYQPRSEWSRLMKSMKEAISTMETNEMRKGPSRFYTPV